MALKETSLKKVLLIFSHRLTPDQERELRERWMAEVAAPRNIAFIQGEFGAVYLTVNRALELGLVPIYATSRREVREKCLPDGSVIQESAVCRELWTFCRDPSVGNLCPGGAEHQFRFWVIWPCERSRIGGRPEGLQG